jgi:DnaJ-class molecular chaperone
MSGGSSSDLSEEDGNYYATLNVSRDCSQEDVTKAYREAARVFHPDKHQGDELKEGAKEAFGKLQEAYEVLNDSHKRQVYDIYGKQVCESLGRGEICIPVFERRAARMLPHSTRMGSF